MQYRCGGAPVGDLQGAVNNQVGIAVNLSSQAEYRESWLAKLIWTDSEGK